MYEVKNGFAPAYLLTFYNIEIYKHTMVLCYKYMDVHKVVELATYLVADGAQIFSWAGPVI